MRIVLSKPLELFLLLTILLAGCGPETIVLRSGLDTPAQHVANGNRFLKNGKMGAALREFIRARELNPEYGPAYVGLGIIKGRQGDIEGGLKLMEKAEKLAENKSEMEMVDQGFCTLYRLQRQKKRLP